MPTEEEMAREAHGLPADTADRWTGQVWLWLQRLWFTRAIRPVVALDSTGALRPLLDSSGRIRRTATAGDDPDIQQIRRATLSQIHATVGGALPTADPTAVVTVSKSIQAQADGSITATELLAATPSKKWEILGVAISYVRSGGATEANALIDETGGSNPIALHGPFHYTGPINWRQATANTAVAISGVAAVVTGSTYVAVVLTARLT